MALKQPKSLRDIFQDANYAWDLLQAQIKLQTSETEAINGEDISNLLQLYMRGVEKMNTLVDIRESFFKNRVTNLMSRPIVIKILNKPMTKKSQPAVLVCSSPDSSKNTKQKQQIYNSQSPKKLDAHKELQLKQKKQSLQMRLAYSAEENNPDALKKMLAEHSQKETIISSKIQKIVDSHQQRLKKRISDRKMKTLTAKSKSQIVIENQIQFFGNQGSNQFQERIGDVKINQNVQNYKNKIESNGFEQATQSYKQKLKWVRTQEQADCKQKKQKVVNNQKLTRKRSLSVQLSRVRQEEAKNNRQLSLDNKNRKDINIAFLYKAEEAAQKKQMLE